MSGPTHSLGLPLPRIERWTCDATTTVGNFRVFSVERHAMRDARGATRGDFYTYACPDWCNVVALTDDGALVLVWQYRFGTAALTLEIPGGVIEPGESPLAAAGRELREETGYEASSFEPLLRVEPNPALQNNQCHTFLARGARLRGPPKFDDNEECEVALVPAAQIPALLDEGHVRHALVVCALEAYLRREHRGPP